MLNVIFSNTSSGAEQAIFSILGQVPGRKILLVPDSYTLGMEKAVMEHIGPNATFDIEVTGFSRLASKETGTGILSKEGGVLIMKRAIDGSRKELRHYSGVAGVQGFANEMFAVVTSMRLNGITPERLREAAGEMDECATLRKNRDIAILYERYLEELKKEGFDGTSRAERFAGEIASNAALKGVNVFAVGFDSLSAIQIKILTELALVGNVTAALPNGYGQPNAELYPAESVRRLLTYARDRGVVITKPVRHREALKEPFRTLHANIFSGSDKKVKNDGSVVLFGEANIFEEFNAVAREIVRLVRREGLRFKDIAVVNAAPENGKELDEVFTRYDIPHYIDLRYPLKDTVPVKYIVAATDVARFNFRRDKLMRLLKSPLFDWNEEEKFRFENYALKFNLDYNDFTEPLKEEGAAFEELRQALYAAVEPFLSRKKTIGYAEAVISVVRSEEFTRLTEAAVDGIDDNLKAANLRAGERITALMEEYIRLSGENEEGLEEFRSAFDAAVAGEELALIPRSVDCVFVGELRSGYIYGTRALFIIGATQNALPAKHDFRSIISAADAMRLEEAGVKLYPTPYDSMREEQFAITDLLSGTERLYVGYPMSSDEGALRPSSVITELSERTSTPVIKLSDRFSPEHLDTAESVEDFISSPQNAIFGYLMYKDKFRKGVRAAIEKAIEGAGLDYKCAGGGAPERVPMELPVEDGARISSVSRIECFYNCPYRYFLRYGLGLKEREEGKLRPPDIGILSHKAAEIYFGRFLRKVHTTPAEVLEAAREEAAEEVVSSYRGRGDLSKASMRSLKRSLVYSLEKLTENILCGDFEPTAVEYAFGFGYAPAMKIDSARVALRGKIDRIDSDAERTAVIDYKTGSDKLEMRDIYYGRKLQSAIYLKHAAERTGRKAAGAFYAPLKAKYSKSGQKYRYDGFVQGDLETLFALDSSLEEGLSGTTRSDVVPASVTVKEGEIRAIAQSNVLSDKELQETLDYAAGMAAEAVREIEDGVNGREPLKGECERCSYKEVCAGRLDRERALFTKPAPYSPRRKEGE